MEVVGVIAGVPGLIQIIQALITAVCGVPKKDVAPKVAQNLIHSLQNVDQVLKGGKDQGLWDKQQFEQHKSTITQWTTELASLDHVLQPSNIKKETRRSLKKFYFVLTDLEKTLNEWSTRVTQIQTELTFIMADIQQRVTREILNETVTARLREILRPCSASFIPNKTPGTCEWIWSHSTFSDWVKGSSTMPNSYLNRVLCLHGMKGCGKSVLIKSIAQKLGEQVQINLQFSFWFGNENQRKLEDLLRTLVWQISRRVADDDHEKVSKLLTRNDGIDQRSLVEAFRTALSGISQKVYCTIDGIDESNEDWNSDTDGCISTILDLVKNHTNLHVLLAGREASVRTLLKKAVPRLQITEDLIRGDIDRLIAVEIEDSLQNYPPGIRTEVQNDLEARTQVMFLWVTLVLKELRRCSSVEDVRQTLEQIPHDLDREYHRLFLQLMRRTKGSRAKPSISMKRARYVLSSILVCPEPMTGGDLCYAYATQVNVNGTIEDDLITVDGIADACGDFVRVTEGRYHIIHASAIDFLIRPKKEWELEATDVSYFRVDLTEAQGSMSLACLKYIKSIDLGYPLTDGGTSSLSSRFKFLSYAARYLPFHLTEGLQENEQLRLEVTEFVTRHHFCALIEYILATSQNALHIDFIYSVHLVEFFGSEMECMELDRAFILELERREKDFGVQDECYQSWLALDFLFPTKAQKLSERQARNSKSLAGNRRAVSQVRGNTISLLRRHIGNTHGPTMQRLSGGLKAVSQAFAMLIGTGTDLLTSSAASLPVPLLLLAALAALATGQLERSPLAEKLATLSVRKTRGKGDIFEFCSLLLLAEVRYHCNDDISEETEEIVRESVRIANRLPALPFVQRCKVEALEILVLILLGQDGAADSDVFIRMYDDLIGKNRRKCKSSLWDQIGTADRIESYDFMAQKLHDNDNYTASAHFAGQGIAILQSSRLKPAPKHLSLFFIRSSALYLVDKIDECISNCQQLLDCSTKLVSEPFVKNIRWETKVLRARCHVAQGDATEADKWFCKAADELDRLGTDKQLLLTEPWHYVMLEDLALLGQYKLCQSSVRELLEDKEISYSDNEEDLGFGPLEPLVSKLMGIDSIESNYREFLRCCSLIMAEKGLLDAAGKANWRKQRPSLIYAYENVQSFSKRIPLLKLKYIDTCLRQGDGLLNAVEGYGNLGRFLFKKGEIEAADLVSSDAASRIFSKLSSDYNPPCSFKLASVVYLYAGKFSKYILLLCQAYRMELQGNRGAHDNFKTEIYYASDYVATVEEFEEDLENDLRLLFLEKSCEHLAKAIRASDEMNGQEASEFGEGQSDGKHNAEESRKERVTDLETRLEDLHVGSMLTKAMASLEAAVPETKDIS